MDGQEGKGWRQSSRCGADSCVQVARLDGEYAMRDSTDVNGPLLRFSAVEWHAFIAGVRDGEFD